MLSDDEDDFLVQGTIFSAAKEGDLLHLKHLIDLGTATVHDLTSLGTSALHIAARQGQAEICRYLLQKGASASQLDEQYGQSAVHWAAAHIAALRLFIELGVDMTIRDKSGDTVLHKTIDAQSFLSILYVLHAQPGIDVDSRDNGGRTPLMLAALAGNDLMVELLLHRGADPNARAMHGGTPLHFAVHGQPIEGVACIRNLIAHGANINVRDDEGNSPSRDAKHLGRQAMWKQATTHSDAEEGFNIAPRRKGGYKRSPTFSLPSNSFNVMSVIEAAIEHSKFDICPCCGEAVDQTLKLLQNVDLPLDEKLRIVFFYCSKVAQPKKLNHAANVERLLQAILIGELLISSNPSSENDLTLTFNRSHERFLGKFHDMSLTSVAAKKPILRRLIACFQARFKGTGDIQDFDVGVLICRRCMEVAEDDLPCDLSLLCALFTTKFELGESPVVDVIEEALMHGRASLEGAYKDHPIHCYYLAMALHARYTYFNREEDIVGSISLLRHSVAMAQANRFSSDEHPQETRLSLLRVSLAFVLLHKVTLGKDAAVDADECVDILRQAVLSDPLDISCRFELARALHKRCVVVTSDLSDLDESLSILGHILDEQRLPSDLRVVTLETLAEFTYDRYNKLYQVDDLNMAWSVMELIRTQPHNHGQHRHGNNTVRLLARVYWERYCVSQRQSDLDQSFHYLDKLRHEVQLWTGNRLVDAIRELAPVYHAGGRFKDALSEYRLALELLPKYLMIGRNYRSTPLVSGWDVLGADAAATGAACGAYRDCIELLEAGRAIGWSRGLQMRGELKQLETEHPEHARRFDQLSRSLEKTELSHSLLSTSGISASEAMSGTGYEEQQFQLLLQWEALLDEIRTFEGYRDFLSHMKYDELRKVAEHGPVVFINISLYRNDAFILAHSTNDRPDVVLLEPDLHIMTDNWADDLLSAQRKVEEGQMTDKDISKSYLQPIVRNLWRYIVKPVRDRLTVLAPYARRLWWVPTRRLTFLPLHMATNGTPAGIQPFQQMIPSYAITLTSLLRARSSASFNSAINVLVVGCGSPASHSNLPELDTKTEIRIISKVFSDIQAEHGTLLSLEDEGASVQATISQCQQHSWLHLACHGIQSSDKPYESYFALNDGNLYLADIAGVRLEGAQLAFLSACQTATGIPALGDEAMHLAAGLHFAGFCATVATMWSVDDKVAKSLSRLFYKHLMNKNAGSPSVLDTAEAMWYATRKLQAKGVAISLLAPFIHIGV